MATLQFKGKSAVWNHHLSVPYHTLEKDAKKSLKGTDAEENLIIEGDNLLALKSLLPQYQGRIKCIYIDPPYNTGNEGWVYSDNVNSPTIQDWVGKIVGKQGDDLTRHDKWLCMMTPRLKLLRDLLTNDGVIFLSIDDNEIDHLKTLMNEVFEEENFVGTLIWQRAKGGGNAKELVRGHDYILVYKKNIETDIVLTQKGDKSNTHLARYKKHPEDYLVKDDILYFINDDVIRKVFGKYEKGTERRCEYEDLVKIKGGAYKKEVDEKIKSGEFILKKNKNGKHFICRLEQVEDMSHKMYSIISGFLSEVGKNDLAALGLADTFEYPKPIGLIKTLLDSFNDKNALVLDSFAGSGTTAQAVLELNKQDGGNRKYIIVQLPEEIKKETPAYKMGFRWVHEITRERIKRVIAKNKYKTGFTYHTLGSAIDAESILTGKLPTYKEFAKYVYYLATGKNHPDEKKIKEEDSFVGKTDHQSVYLIYEKNADALKKLAITLDWAQKTHKKDSNKKIVYAPACYLDDEALEQYNIKFVSIPYNLFERTT